MNTFFSFVSGMFVLLVLSLPFSACKKEGASTSYPEVGKDSIAQGKSEGLLIDCRTLRGFETIDVAGVPVDVQVPKSNYIGDLLILHAWGDDRTSWCKRSRLCRKATNKGYRVIMPDFGKSIYASRRYEDMRDDWRGYPTMDWLRDTLLPELQNKFCLLEINGQNFVLGVSSGARGAVRLAQERPELFVGVAALSGDYDPGQMQGDNIYRGFLGAYAEHADRWSADENICAAVNRINAPVYLGHGEQDDVIPDSQTRQLYNVLRKARPNLRVTVNFSKKRGHGYAYWNTEIPNILRFFESVQAHHPESS